MNSLIPVLEIFGPTIQGEGLVIGQKTMFVRTAGCDYSCSWCDSAFTWDGTAKDEIRQMTPKEIYEELIAVGGNNFAHVTLSGGNPALYRQMDGLVQLLHDKGVKVAIETQGSRWQDWLYEVDDVTLSPKPPSSGMTTDWGRLDEIVDKLSKREDGIAMKIVVFDDADLVFAESVYKRYPNLPMVLQVGNSDLAETDATVLLKSLLRRYLELVDRVMESAVLRNVRVLPQLHTFLWGNKRGV